jgi:hypothetical protein
VEYRNFGDIGTSTRPGLDLVFADEFLHFSWPAPASDYLLQQTQLLGTANGWTTFSNRPGFFNGRCRLTLPASTHARFFRLIHSRDATNHLGLVTRPGPAFSAKPRDKNSLDILLAALPGMEYPMTGLGPASWFGRNQNELNHH